MEKEFLKIQQQKLEIEKERLAEEIKKLEEYPDYGDMQEDNITELQDYQNNLSIKDQLQKLLNEVNDALFAIEQGTYGQCSECKNSIETERLLTLPFVKVCISCEQKTKK